MCCSCDCWKLCNYQECKYNSSCPPDRHMLCSKHLTLVWTLLVLLLFDVCAGDWRGWVCTCSCCVDGEGVTGWQRFNSSHWHTLPWSGSPRLHPPYLKPSQALMTQNRPLRHKETHTSAHVCVPTQCVFVCVIRLKGSSIGVDYLWPILKHDERKTSLLPRCPRAASLLQHLHCQTDLLWTRLKITSQHIHT